MIFQYIVYHFEFALFPAAAARSEADESILKRPRSLLSAFNNDAQAAVTDAPAAVPAIVASQEGVAPSAAEAAAAVLAGFKLDAERARQLHDLNPGAGEGNSRLTIEITHPAQLTGSAITRHVLKALSVVFRRAHRSKPRGLCALRAGC